MSHKGGGWHKPQPAWKRRQATHTAIGEHDTIVITKRPTPPRDSWWTRPVQSREEFDRLVAERSRDAGWVGASSVPESRR
jgi:hypothetical protein